MTCVTRQRGFTLVEALVALVLLAVVVPTALRAISISTQVAAVSSDRSQAAMLAETRIDQLVVTGDWQTTGLEGNFEDLFDRGMFDETVAGALDKYTWTAELEDWDAGDARQLRVTVHWQRRSTRHAVTLTTLVQEAVR